MRSAPARKRSIPATPFKKKGKSSALSKKVINRGTRKYFSQMAIGALVFLVAFIFLGGYSLYKYLNQTFASASSPSSYSVIGEDVITLAFIEVESISADPVILNSLKYIVFDKNDDKVSIFDIPLSIKIDMAGKFGEEYISKVFALGALNSTTPIETGIESVSNTLMRIFGYSVDRYILIDSGHSEVLLQSFRGGGLGEILNLQTASELKKATVSNLNTREYYSLVTFSSQVVNDNIATFSVTQEDVIDSERIDGQISDINFDGAISQEGMNVAILNGTDFSGIASLGARIVGNAGGRIVAVSNASGVYDESFIVTDFRDSTTLNYLSRVLGIKKIISKEEAADLHENEVDRSDITVIVGFDTAESLY